MTIWWYLVQFSYNFSKKLYYLFLKNNSKIAYLNFIFYLSCIVSKIEIKNKKR